MRKVQCRAIIVTIEKGKINIRKRNNIYLESSSSTIDNYGRSIKKLGTNLCRHSATYSNRKMDTKVRSILKGYSLDKFFGKSTSLTLTYPCRRVTALELNPIANKLLSDLISGNLIKRIRGTTVILETS